MINEQVEKSEPAKFRGLSHFDGFTEQAINFRGAFPIKYP